MSTPGQPTILVVEDEFLVALDIEATFLDASWNVVGPVPDIRQALDALQKHTPDAVCLDMNLNGVPTSGLAAELRKLGIPFVVLTGYGNVVDAAYQGAPIVHKPFMAEELLSAVRTAMHPS
jgi:DNA-binding NtrC family response regulator